jgi:hypothetical protein
MDPDDTIVRSAELFADALVAQLNTGADVLVNLEGMPFVPPTYFNVVLIRLADVFGIAIIGSRVTFTLKSNVYREIYERSLAAVSKSVSGPSNH